MTNDQLIALMAAILLAKDEAASDAECRFEAISNSYILLQLAQQKLARKI